MTNPLLNINSLIIGLYTVTILGLSGWIGYGTIGRVVRGAQTVAIIEIADQIERARLCSADEITGLKRPYDASLFGRTLEQGNITVTRSAFLFERDRPPQSPMDRKKYLVLEGKTDKGDFVPYAREVRKSSCPERGMNF